jgi:hypothetical protein
MQAVSGTSGNSGIFIYRTMLLSVAFLSLNNSGKTMLLALLNVRKRESYKDRKTKKTVHVLDGNNLEMTYVTLKKVWGLNQQAVSRAIDDLLAKGFIKIVHQGGLGEHDKARYSLVDDYQQWTSKTPAIRIRERDVRRGYQGKENGFEYKTRSQNHTLTYGV